MKQKIILIALMAASLTACGNPTSNGAGTEQGSMSSMDTAIQWTKKLVRGWTAKATLQIPASGAIADALFDEKFGGTPGGVMMRQYLPYLSKDGFAVGLKALGPGADIEKLKKVLPAGTVINENARFLVPVAMVTQAYRGWQINLLGGFGDKKATDEEIKAYLGGQEAAVEYTNTLFTEIATKLNNDVGVLEDPETAKVEIQKIFLAIPKATLKQMWFDAVDRADKRGNRTTDLSGTQGVDWSADGGSFSGNPDGLTWTKSGVAWFGKGALSGKVWTIGLESSISKSTDKSSGGSESVSGSTGEKSSAGAQPK